MRYLSIYLTLFFAFLLGSHEGFVALWTQPGGNPAYVFPYTVSSLPVEDQRMLEAGIPIDSEESLMRILEDYLS